MYLIRLLLRAESRHSTTFKGTARELQGRYTLLQLQPYATNMGRQKSEWPSVANEDAKDCKYIRGLGI